MAQRRVCVTVKAVDETRVADVLVEGATLLQSLYQRGALAEIGERLRIARQGGYCGLDIWMVLLVYFTTGASVGLKGFWEQFRAVAGQVAVLGGRRQSASPSSVSRALNSVDVQHLRSLSGWLLTGVLQQFEELLGSTAVQTRDACGQFWQVFDLDPTVTALRHRALPASDELPAAKRRSKATGLPGHRGRKRGDIVFRRPTVQHAGSGLWVWAHLSPGNGEGVADLEPAIAAIAQLCERMGHALSRAAVRLDGEFGHVPYIDVFRRAGLPFLTRLNRPRFYEDPHIHRQLREAARYRVRDSLSGPRRLAVDLGTIMLYAGKDTRRPDGQPYEPVQVRLLASLFPQAGKATHGRILDGMQVELFVTDLPADGWPAALAIAFYFARGGQENRFAQEDRELGLDRIVSYHLPGQEFATLVALFLWNLRVVQGVAIDPPPHELAAQQPHEGPVDAEAAQPQPDDPPAPDQAERAVGDEPTRLAPAPPPSTGSSRWPSEAPQPPCDAPAPDATASGAPEASLPPLPGVPALLAELSSEQILGKRVGWGVDVATGTLLCPDNRSLALTTVRTREQTKGHLGLIFRRPDAGCENCSRRQHCFRSTLPSAAKRTEVLVPTELANRVRERLAQDRAAPLPPARAASPLSSEPAGATALANPSPAHAPKSCVHTVSATPAHPPGPYAVAGPLFLPAAARRLFAATFRGATLHLELQMPPPPPRRSSLLALDPADRQRRRKTWTDNLQRYASAPDVLIRVEIAGLEAFQRLWRQHSDAPSPTEPPSRQRSQAA